MVRRALAAIMAATMVSVVTVAEARGVVYVRDCVFTIGGFCPAESLLFSLVATVIIGVPLGGLYFLRAWINPPPRPPRTHEEAEGRINDAFARVERNWRYYVKSNRRRFQFLVTLLRGFVPDQLEHLRDELPGFIDHAGTGVATGMILDRIRRSGTHPEAEFVSAIDEYGRLLEAARATRCASS
jgi:hypothetical protein